jgi:hypothetical protein
MISATTGISSTIVPVPGMQVVEVALQGLTHNGTST